MVDGERIKHWRLARRMTIRDLAQASGVNHSAISLIERNKREPRPSTLGRLADALQIAVVDLLKQERRGP